MLWTQAVDVVEASSYSCGSLRESQHRTTIRIVQRPSPLFYILCPCCKRKIEPVHLFHATICQTHSN